MAHKSYIVGVIVDTLKFLIDLPYYTILILASLICSLFQCVWPRKRKCIDQETILVENQKLLQTLLQKIY